ncbi:DNA-binding response regulator [Nocardioides baekrokdamisoli]|uniref:DNA-binding response regulator n=1 Tax=Nocardioides baekrokdamisoli TaxID=1804624 RepID=A0A3G9IQ73_9ACTN|nr:response regulator transcription factor [Nocardioides baekrokdamisoli]BBH15761.1 DNA-binding response regulator [Nocardioides baekrokdamisoli]
MTIQVVVADDHKMFRAGVIELLHTFDDLEVVGQASTGVETLALVQDLQPDVLLLDLDMPDTVSTGFESVTTAVAVRTASPGTKVVVLTMHDDADLVRKLIHAGVSSYLVKSAGREELYAAIAAAARDENSVMVSVSRATATALSSGLTEGPSILTAREHDVLQCLARGGTNRSIGRELHLAEATIKRHLATIYNKLDAHTRLEVVRKAHALGLLS